VFLAVAAIAGPLGARFGWPAPGPATQLAAALAALAAAALSLLDRRFSLYCAAGLLGLARAPAALPADLRPDAARPLALQGRLREHRRDAAGRARGVLDRLADPNARPLDLPARPLEFAGAWLDERARAGDRVAVQGLLVRERGRERLLEARMHAVRRGADAGSWLPRLRDAVARRLGRVLPPAEAGMARALLLGERDGLEATRRHAYRDLGLLHLLAVSGMHLWLWDALLRRILRGRSAWLRAPMLAAAAVLAGGRPAVVRALAALLLRDFLARRGRPVRGAALWGAALWIEVALVPPRSAGLGFLLSYAATLALVACPAPPDSKRWRRVLQPSCAAFLATAPLLHAVQGTLEPWSAPLTPLFALLLPLRMSCAALALLPGCGAPVALVLAGVGGLEDGVLGIAAALPGSPLALTRLSSGWLLGVAGLGLAGLRARHAPATRRACGAACAAAILWLAMLPPRAAQPGLLALPVGHGLAVVVAGTEHSLVFDLGSADLAPQMLVDRVLLPALGNHLWPLPATAVISHADSDHGNALPRLREFEPALRTVRLDAGERWLPDFAPWAVRLLACRPAARDASNAGGLVLELRLGAFRAVLLGDQFGFALRELRDRLDPGPIDLLLLPHHGLTTDGLHELLVHLRPRAAWASCGAGDLPLAAAPVLRRAGVPLRETRTGALQWPP